MFIADSNIQWIIIITILTTLLLTVTILLAVMCALYCQKVSVLKMMMVPAQSNHYDSLTTSYMAPMIEPPVDSDLTLQRNPSYGISAQPKRRRQLNDNYDYVVTDGEMIETVHNPSYVMTTVGSNELQDNPSYQPAFTVVV